MKKQIFFIAVLCTLILTSCGEDTPTQNDAQSNKSNISSSQSSQTPEQSEPEQDAEQNVEADSSLTMGQKNALQSAKDYLAFQAFSHSGLIQQLEFEGYSTEDATYAADNCGADWNEQASKSAQAYLDMSSFSKDGLIEQLIFEGFTQEQAEYGVSAVGY